MKPIEAELTQPDSTTGSPTPTEARNMSPMLLDLEQEDPIFGTPRDRLEQSFIIRTRPRRESSPDFNSGEDTDPETVLNIQMDIMDEAAANVEEMADVDKMNLHVMQPPIIVTGSMKPMRVSEQGETNQTSWGSQIGDEQLMIHSQQMDQTEESPIPPRQPEPITPMLEELSTLTNMKSTFEDSCKQ